MIDDVVQFFSHPFFSVVGGISTIAVLLGFVYSVYLFLRGILPISIRFGRALASRKVVIVADADMSVTLNTTLLETGLFKSQNIQIFQPNDSKLIPRGAVIVADWSSCVTAGVDVDDLRADGRTPIVIYALPGSIDRDVMPTIANKPNVVVVNFRGRLLNDVLTSLMTTV